MGEKEIKPADPKPETPKTDDHPHTQERPGTGAKDPKQEKPQRPTNQGAAGSGGYSGHDRYEDGYTMGREKDGSFWLEHPDGGRATWDPDSESWKGTDGSTKSGDWSGGHRPTKYETGPGR